MYFPGDKLYVIIENRIKPVTVLKSDGQNSLIAFQHKGHALFQNNELYSSEDDAKKACA